LEAHPVWQSFLIHSVLGIIHLAFKNPSKKAELKSDLLSVRDSINELYPGE